MYYLFLGASHQRKSNTIEHSNIKTQ